MKTLSGLQFYQFFIPNCCCWFCFWKKRRRFCHEPVGIGHWVLGLLVVWVQCCERELVRSLVTLQQEHRLRAEDGLNVPKREAGDLQICFLEAVLPKDTYRARTCKLKSNGTTTLQHLPPYAQNCMWQDSRWCTNVKRICLDLFLQRIPQAAFKLRKAQVHYNTKLYCLHSWMETAQRYCQGCYTRKAWAEEIQRNVKIWQEQWIFNQIPVVFSSTYKISTVISTGVGNIPPTTSQCLNSRVFFLKESFLFKLSSKCWLQGWFSTPAFLPHCLSKEIF